MQRGIWDTISKIIQTANRLVFWMVLYFLTWQIPFVSTSLHVNNKNPTCAPYVSIYIYACMRLVGEHLFWHKEEQREIICDIKWSTQMCIMSWQRRSLAPSQVAKRKHGGDSSEDEDWNPEEDVSYVWVDQILIHFDYDVLLIFHCQADRITQHVVSDQKKEGRKWKQRKLYLSLQKAFDTVDQPACMCGQQCTREYGHFDA